MTTTSNCATSRAFSEDGDKTKITLRFRGREMAHQEIGTRMLERLRADLDEQGQVEQMPKMEGRQMIMVLAPKKKKYRWIVRVARRRSRCQCDAGQSCVAHENAYAVHRGCAQQQVARGFRRAEGIDGSTVHLHAMS